MIFSRRRGNAGRHSASKDNAPNDSASKDSAATQGATKDNATRNSQTKARTANVDDKPDVADADEAPFGPYDVTEAPDDDQERLDLGALHIPAIAGVEIHLQAGPQGEVQQIQLSHSGSRLQLGAFAAPRTEGIWDDVRETLRSSLAAGGARPEVVDGEYGLEVRARVRDGSVTTDVRHVGIDGPRWFVHGVFLGAAAADPGRAGPLRDVLRGLVVDRGIEARPVSEALPLRLPPDAATQLAEAAAAEESSGRQAT